MAKIKGWYSQKRHGKTQHVPISERRGRRYSEEESITRVIPKGATGWGKAGIATFPGKCLSCGEPIHRGDRIYFRRGQGAIHADCEPPREKWIQTSIAHKGALRETVKHRYGQEAFEDGIKQEYVEKMAEEPGITGKRARLALTLRKLGRRRKSRE